ncbi:polysaccharide deacetylase family protein [Chitinophaga sp. GCM10012297]|uniref:Polysaccharide deacetylase family protein n=1 Tax=Chitinophaga chungangae TaxID=2821488 RepID=A0ABS3YHQ1_9BACT|nr:polysaccharide deacetylase family protein [Chitinophaga chungangae]MBO9154218.1 polysaccharide deacetylase family protein [Chitinophaga chungangae]
MQFKKRLFYTLSTACPIGLLQKAPASRLLLPYHHLVSDRDVPHIAHLYPYKGTKAFEEDLDYLLKHFNPVSLEEVIAAKRENRPMRGNSFLLTFDDGLREVTETIAPMLRRKGVPGVFFLNSAFLDNRSLFYKFKVSLAIDALRKQTPGRSVETALAEALQAPQGEDAEISLRRITWRSRTLADKAGEILGLDFDAYLKHERPFMTLDEVGELVKQGFSIGGHSIDHPYYKELSLEEQVGQTLGSVDVLANRFGIGYRVFAFPHTDAGVSRAFFKTVLEGENPLDLVFGTGNQQRDMLPGILHRFNCERPYVPIGESVKGILLLNGLKALAGRDVVKRR